MSGIYRSIAIAIGLILFTTLGQAQEQAQSSQGNTATQQQPSQTFPIPLPVEIIQNKSETDASNRRYQEGRSREIRDLVAQEGMNAATQAMNEATQRMSTHSMVSMIAVCIGTVLLIATLVLTYRASKSAQAAVEVTRKIGEAQTRAYVHAKGAKIKSTYDGTFEKIILTVENVGETPAKWFSVGVEFRFGEDTQITKHAEISVVDRVWGPIAPNTPLTVNTTLPDEQRMNKVGANFEAIIKGQSSNIGYILGRIRYCTIYDEIFATEFIFAYRQHNGDKMFRPMSVMRAFEPSD